MCCAPYYQAPHITYGFIYGMYQYLLQYNFTSGLRFSCSFLRRLVLSRRARLLASVSVSIWNKKN